MECIIAHHILFTILFGDDADLEMNSHYCYIWYYFITITIYLITLYYWSKLSCIYNTWYPLFGYIW